MKKLLIALIVLSLSACCITGCSNDGGSSSSEITTPLSSTTTPPPLQSQPDVTLAPADSTSAPDSTSETGGSSGTDPSNDTLNLDNLDRMFPDFDEETGFVSKSSEEIESVFSTSSKLRVKDLDGETVDSGELDGSNDTSVYKVNLTNTKLPQLVNGAYLYSHSLPDDDNSYFITIGLDTTGEELIEPYSFINTPVTYYSMLEESEENSYVAVPVIVGNDDIGYWMMKPMMELMGVDVSNMATINLKEPQSPVTPAEGNDLVLITTNIMYDSGETLVKYELTNNLGKSVFVDNVVVMLNGSDITENTIMFLEADNGETASGSFTVPGTIAIGDQLTISGTVVDSDSYDEIGSIVFPLVFSQFINE